MNHACTDVDSGISHVSDALTTWSFRGACEAREPGIQFSRDSLGLSGFRVRRYAPPRNDSGACFAVSREIRLIQWFELHHLRGMIVADPHRRRRGAVVDEHAAEVAVARQRIVHPFAGLG